MSTAADGPPPELLAYLERADHAPAPGWAADPPRGETHCAARLVRRLSEVARPLPGVARVFVAGCPVVHHPGGAPIAAAAGTLWFAVRGEVDAITWDVIDAFPADVGFERGVDAVRRAVRNAYDRAGAASWR